MMISTEFFSRVHAVRDAADVSENPEKTLAEIHVLLQDEDVRREFFNHLKTAKWLGPLKAAGYFSNPPPVQRSEQGMRFVPWPASGYLAKVASQAPEDVTRIFNEIRELSPSVSRDLISAVKAMPASYGARLSSQIVKAFNLSAPWLNLGEASEVCIHLAKGGEDDGVMYLLKELFGVTPEKVAKARQRDEYWFKTGLTALIPVIMPRRPREFMDLICDWLEVALMSEGSANSHDLSEIWRPAIEEHPQNHNYNVKAELVGILRESFERSVRDQLLSLKDALAMLSMRNFDVFRRLRVHLINQFADQAPGLAQEAIMDRSVFENHHLKHEYAMLVGRRYPLLTESQKQQWLGWIADGPKVSKGGESEQTQEDSKRYIEYWQFQRLHPIRNYLIGAWKEFYETMHSSHGEPEFVDMNFKSSVRWGAESPIGLDVLHGKSLKEVIDIVVSWKPESLSPDAPSIEGLTSVFGDYVQADPGSSSKQAEILIDQPANFVRVFLDRVVAGLRDGKQIEIGPILKLSAWIVEQPVNVRTTIESNWDFIDRDWQWARNSVSEFLQKLCELAVGEKFDHVGVYRNEIVRLLESLTKDPAESSIVDKGEDREDLKTREYLILAINSPRGKALDATFKYARCVMRHLDDGNQKSGYQRSFDQIPEVRSILEWQLLPGNASFSGWAMIGANLGLLFWIDERWVRERVNEIFDLGPFAQKPESAFGWAAWNTFLVWVHPYAPFYELLGKQYAFAVSLLPTMAPKERDREQPIMRLAEHLVVYYAHGLIELNEGSVLRELLTESPPEIRTHAIQFVGQSTRNEEKMSPKVIERFMTLWDWYWPNIGVKVLQKERDKSLFGWWFVSGQFPDQWSLGKLREFTSFVGVPEPDDLIIERLATVAEIDIPAAVSIIDMMERADSAEEGWHLHGWSEPAKKILRLGIKSAVGAREIALAIVDRVGRRGYMDFGELLKE